MHVDAANVTLAVLGLSGGELILVLGAILLLFGSKWIPEFHEGLRRGMWEFRKSSKQVSEDLDEAASDAGRSFAGIQGPPAVQAITPGNEVAELYHPVVFGERKPLGAEWKNILSLLRHLIGTPRARLSLLLLIAATAATIAVTLMHPLIATQFKGSPVLIWTLDVLIGTTGSAVVFSVVRELLRKRW
jgi:sec-independent protein translocase protein TatA